MPRVSLNEKLRAEQQSHHAERRSTRSARTTPTEDKKTKSSSSTRRRRSLSAGLDRKMSSSSSSKLPQHALVTPQRYAKPKVSKATLNLDAAPPLLNDSDDQHGELERLAAQQRAMASFEYYSGDDDDSEQVEVLDMTTDDEASFDHNLVIEKKRKPRKSKRPVKTTSSDSSQLLTNMESLSTLPTTMASSSLLLSSSSSSPTRTKPKKSTSSSAASLPTLETLSTMPSQSKQRSKSLTTRVTELTDIVESGNDIDTSASSKQKKKSSRSSSTSTTAVPPTASGGSPKTKKIKKIKAKSATETMDKATRQNVEEEHQTNATTNGGAVTTPPGTVKRKVKRTQSPSGTSSSRTKRSASVTAPHSARTSRTTVPATGSTPRSASTRAGSRTTGGDILPTINLQDENDNDQQPVGTTSSTQQSPTSKKQKNIVGILRRKKKSTTTDSEDTTQPIRQVARLPSTDDSIRAVAPPPPLPSSRPTKNDPSPNQQQNPAEKMWDYFGASPDVKNSLEADSTHTSAIYQAAVAASPDPPASSSTSTLGGTLSRVARLSASQETSKISSVKEVPLIDETVGDEEKNVKKSKTTKPKESEKKTRSKSARRSPSPKSKKKANSPNSPRPRSTSSPPTSGRKQVSSPTLVENPPLLFEETTPQFPSNVTEDGKSADMDSKSTKTARIDEPKVSPAVQENEPKSEAPQFDTPISVHDRSKLHEPSPTSAMDRGKSPPGIIASRMKAFSKNPTTPTPTPPRQRPEKVHHMDANRFSLHRQDSTGKTPASPMSTPQHSQRSMSLDRSPITPRKIIEAFERLPSSSKRDPLSVSLSDSTHSNTATPNSSSLSQGKGQATISHSTVLRASAPNLASKGQETPDATLKPHTSVANIALKKSNSDESSSSEVSSTPVEAKTKEGGKESLTTATELLSQQDMAMDGSKNSGVDNANLTNQVLQSESRPKNENTEDSFRPALLNEFEEVTVESLPDEVVQVKTVEVSYEEVTIESFPGSVQGQIDKNIGRPSRVEMTRTSSGISQMTEPEFVADEERKVGRLLSNAMTELNAIQKLLDDKKAEVMELQKRKDRLRQERLQKLENADKAEPTGRGGDNVEQIQGDFENDKGSVPKLAAKAQKDWEKTKLNRLKALQVRLEKTNEEIRQLTAQQDEIQELEKKAVEIEFEEITTTESVGIVSEEDRAENREWERAKERRLLSLRRRLELKTREINHLSEQEKEVRNLAAMTADASVDSISLEIDLGELESYADSKALDEEELEWKKAKFRRLESLLANLDEKNEEIRFLEKQKEQLGLYFPTSTSDDEDDEEWEKKKLERLETLSGHLEEKTKEMARLDNESDQDFVSTQSMADTKSVDKKDDDAWERAKRRRLQTLNEHVERKSEELRLLESEEASTVNTKRESDVVVQDDSANERMLSGDREWQKAREQRRELLYAHLERKNQELALLRGQLQGVTRAHAEQQEEEARSEASKGINTELNAVDMTSYVSSMSERAVSVSNDTNRAVADLNSIGDNSDDVELIKDKLERLNELYSQLESKEEEIDRLDVEDDEHSDDKESHETGPQQHP